MLAVESHAKINWFLRILHQREDGYHEIETIFQTISLHDTVRFAESASLSLRCDDPSIPTDDSNLAMRAARAMMQWGARPVEIAITKRIPAGGGLGGGSSNAAATLLGLDRLFDLKTPRKELEAIALSIGSDVPFFLTGGTAYATGRGEKITPLPRATGIPLLLAFPPERMLTAEAYKKLHEVRSLPNDLQQLANKLNAHGVVAGHPPAHEPLGIEMCRQFVSDGILSHAAALENHLEGPVFAYLPRLAHLKKRMTEVGAAWSAMSGSGSTIVGAFSSARERDEAMGKFADIKCVAAETT